MKLIDAIGYLAAGFLLATFCMRSMANLRSVAIASNLAFIVYGYLANLAPVLILHAVLLPINSFRLMQLCSTKTPRGEPAQRSRVSVPRQGPRM